MKQLQFQCLLLSAFCRSRHRPAVISDQWSEHGRSAPGFLMCGGRAQGMGPGAK